MPEVSGSSGLMRVGVVRTVSVYPTKPITSDSRDGNVDARVASVVLPIMYQVARYKDLMGFEDELSEWKTASSGLCSVSSIRRYGLLAVFG